MSALVSAAEPPKLFRYSDMTTGIDNELVAEANRLGDSLRHFESRCTEYPVRVSYLADRLRDYARAADNIDRWVRVVGQGFERADRGYRAAWGLRGQGVFSSRAATVADRLSRLMSFSQRCSLWLQFVETKWALTEALWRIRYSIFMLKYAPWFDLARMPWDLYEKYRSLLAGALIAGSIHFGHAYTGQIIINLPNFLKNFGFSLREIRTWAGLSGHLTHIKYTNLPAHMFWASLALSIPSLVSKWRSDVLDYVGGEYSGTRLASAITVDTALTLAPVGTSYVGSLAGLKIGALIGTAIAPGVGTVIGGAVGAIIGGVAAGWATNEVIERTDIREKAIPWLDEHVFGPIARGISRGIDRVSDWVNEAAQRIHQDFRRIIADAESIVAWLQTDGVRQFDKAVKDKIDSSIPPDREGEEFAGLKLEGELDITAEGLPLYIEGGGDIRIARDQDGNYVVTIEGMAGVGLNLEAGAGKTGKIDLESGRRGRATFEYTFDPRKQGDMTALARLLAKPAIVGTAGASNPLNGLLATGILSASGAIAGKQTDYNDNLTGFKCGGGDRTTFEAIAPFGIASISTEGEHIVEVGFETEEDGQRRNFITFSEHLEAEGSLGLSEGSLAIDTEYKVKDNPTGVEAVFLIEPKVGLSADMFKDALKKKGLPISTDISAGSSLEIKVNTDWDIEAIKAAIFANDGDFDLSALAGMGAIEISRITRSDASFEVDLVLVEFEGSNYAGRKEKLTRDEWGEKL